MLCIDIWARFFVSNMEIEITYSDPEFFKALANPDGFMPELQSAMSEIVTEYKFIASQYAPESEANHPGRVDSEGNPIGYYIRNQGWMSPIGRGRGGSFRKGTLSQGYRLYLTSQQMDQRWTTEVLQNAQEVMGRLRNSATYSGYVQGLDQTLIHKERNWLTVMDVWQSQEIQKIVSDETNKAIENYYNLGA